MVVRPNVVGGVGVGGGALRFSPFVVRWCKESFEGNSSFLLSG